MSEKKLSKIIAKLEEWAPLTWQEEWDNSGLQIGDLNKKITNILILCDIDLKALKKISTGKYDLVITHHPTLFKKIKKIDLNSNIGLIIKEFILSDTALYAMHTNLDIAQGGVNDALIDAFDFIPSLAKPIRPKQKNKLFKISVFVPIDDFEKFRNKLFQKVPSIIGNYANCSFSNFGQGTFKPLENANPYIGKKNELVKVKEAKIEFMVIDTELNHTLQIIKNIHPYEEVAIDVFEQKFNSDKISMAKYIKIKNKINIDDLIQKYKCTLKGDLKKKTASLIAFACGSGGYVIDDLIKIGADVLITGEIGYHDMLRCEMSGISIIELGHRQSEEFVLPVIKKYLLENFHNLKIELLKTI